MLLGPDLLRSGIRAGGIAMAGWLVPTLAVAAPTEPNTLVNPLEDAQECRYCHQHGNDAASVADPPYSAFFGWQGSMMGNAARDPVFWAAIALAEQDEPDETTDCVRCHSPRAFLEGRGDAITMAELTEPDLNGVDCEVCHRMVEDVATPRGNARYEIDDTLVGPGVPRRGPWDYTDGVPQPDPAELHPTAYDPFVGSSALCGTCHNVTTGRDRVDDAGNSMGMQFNEQRTYSEWANSAFAVAGDDFRSCIDCHMAEVDNKAGCETYTEQNLLHPTGGRRHNLHGANRFMMEIIRDNYGLDIGEVYWNLAIEDVDAFLPTSATMEVEAPDSVDLTQGLSGLDVTVTNETGHKLPSGYSEGRVAWIEVVATYNDQVVWSSGSWDQTAGTIEEDAQVRRYEGIAENLADGTRNHLLQNNHWIVDTRIPPRGLTQDPQTDPVGDRFTLQGDNTWPNQDSTSYSFDANETIVDATPGDDTDDELTVTVRFRYLINTPEYIQQLVDDNMTNASGDEVAAMFEAAGGATPVDLAEQQVLTIPITGFGDGVATASTTDDSSSGASVGGSSSGSNSDGVTGPTAGATETDTTAGAENGDDGCGCTVRPSGPASWMWLPLLLGLRRRQR